MGSNRSYDFVTGFETSTAPTATTPTVDSDILNKGYADDTYAKLAYWGDGVADTTALKAVGSADRSDKQCRLKEDTGDIWAFDSASSATEDGTTVIQPTSGTGRWVVVSGGSGTAGGTASALEALQIQNQLASIGMTTSQMDNSVRANGLEVPAHTYSHSRMIENYTSGGASIKVVHNPVVVFDSDKDYDSITGWAAGGAGTTLAATAGSTKVGSNHFSFNKDGSAVGAYIRHTLAAQTLSVGANYRVYFWVDMPSVTGLSNIYVKIMGAATTDFSKWDLTTNSAGGALATGYNLMFVDLKNTAASSTGGTVWTYTQLARYVEVGVTTSSAGQTYTGIKFAGLWFSEGDIARFGNKYLEYTSYDTSNKNDMKMASSNSTLDGIVTLSSTVAQNYTAGIAAAAAAKIVRSPASWSQSGLIGFDTSLSSGTIATETEVRIARQLRESLSGNYSSYVDMFTPQLYQVSEITNGTTFKVTDSEDHSLNLLSGNSVHCFTTSYVAGDPQFTLLATKSLTGNASHSAGVTTMAVASTSGMAVGDWVAKQHLTVSASITSATADESFAAMTYDTAPNGAQLLGSRSYPNAASVYSHWWLGAASEALALKDQSGNSRTLVKVGSPNLSATFRSGKYSATSFSAANYIRTAASTGSTLDGNGELIQISFWVYFDGTNVADRGLISCQDGGVDGWHLRNSATTSTLTLFLTTGGADTTLTSGAMVAGWNHVVLQIKSSLNQNIYLNGVLSTVTAGAIGVVASGQALYFGARSTSDTIDTTMALPGLTLQMADVIIWRDGPLLIQSSDVNYLYNGGVPQWMGYNPALVRNEYNLTGQSGSRIAMKAKLNRSTTAVSPYILQAGMIKTG